MSNKTLGIIGGGQLGMFICIAARKIGLKTIVYSQEEDFSARKFCDKHIIGNIKSKKKLENLLKILTFVQLKLKIFIKIF